MQKLIIYFNKHCTHWISMEGDKLNIMVAKINLFRFLNKNCWKKIFLFSFRSPSIKCLSSIASSIYRHTCNYLHSLHVIIMKMADNNFVYSKLICTKVPNNFSSFIFIACIYKYYVSALIKAMILFPKWWWSFGSKKYSIIPGVNSFFFILTLSIVLLFLIIASIKLQRIF